MKKSKKVLGIIVATVMVCGAVVFAACGNGNAPAISESAAKQIAYATLNATAADVQSATVEKENVAGASVYDIEFYVNGVKYEIKVNADTGAVTAVEINNQAISVDKMPTSPLSDKAEYIGTAAALEVALNDAGLKAAEVRVTENKLDYDDGKYVYEIEFIKIDGNVEYEYEIAADDGRIHKKDVENVTVVVPEYSGSADYISVEVAKANALTRASVAAEGVTFLKVEFEVDDGVHVYEVEFKDATYEYECEINALSGAVMDFDKELIEADDDDDDD